MSNSKPPPKSNLEIYQNLMDNDPYFKLQRKSRKFHADGADNKSVKEREDCVFWGITDEQEVYDY